MNELTSLILIYGILIFTVIPVYLFYYNGFRKRIKQFGWKLNRWGDVVFTCEGREFRIKYSPGSRNRSPELRVFTFDTFGANLIIRKETRLDQFYKKIRLNCELEIQDIELDKRFYFECENPGFLNQLFSNSNVKPLILDIFNDFSSIEITKHSCILRKYPSVVFERINQEAIIDAAKKLLIFTSCIPRFTDQSNLSLNSFKIRRLILYSFGYAALAIGIVFIFWAIPKFEVIDTQKAWLMSLGIGFFVILIITSLAYWLIKGFSTSSKVFCVFFLCFAMGTILACRFGGAVYNGIMDISSIQTFNRKVINKYYTSGKYNSHTYYIVLAPWHSRKNNYEFTISMEGYIRVIPGITHYQIWTKSGKFGFEWIVSMISSKAMNNYNQGVSLLRQNKIDQAIEEFNKSLGIEPFDLSYYYRGIAYTKKGNLNQANEDFSKALRISHNDAYSALALKLNLASIKIQKGDYNNAIDDFTNIIEKRPNNIDTKTYANYQGQAYLKRGVAYASINHLDEAIDDFNSTLGLDSMNASALVNLGLCFAQRQNWDQAIVEYNKALKIDPGFFEAYLVRAKAYAKKGNFDQEIANYAQAIKVKPNEAQAYYDLGVAYDKKNILDLAIEDFSKYLEFNPNSGIAYFHRGRAYSRKKEFDQAIADYNKSIEIDPHAWGGFYYRGLAYSFKGNIDQLLADYSKNSGKSTEEVLYKQEYRQALDDLEKAQSLGHPVDPAMLEKLTESAY